MGVIGSSVSEGTIIVEVNDSCHHMNGKTYYRDRDRGPLTMFRWTWDRTGSPVIVPVSGLGFSFDVYLMAIKQTTKAIYEHANS